MISIKFNKFLYKKPAIEKAIGIYSHLATFSLDSEKKYFVVNIEKIKHKPEYELKHEFCNYCFGLTKKWN